MSLVNIYLNETPLTSTKNRFLEKDLPIKIFKENNLFKRKLKKKLFSSKKCLTKNRFFLDDDPFFEQEDYVPEKKKKKKIKSRCYYEVRSRQSRSRSEERSKNEPPGNSGLFPFSCDSTDAILQDKPSGSFGGFTFQSPNVNEKSQDEPSANFESFAFGSSNVYKTNEDKPPENFRSISYRSANVNKKNKGCVYSSPLSTEVSLQPRCFYSASPSMASMDYSRNIPEKIISEMPAYNLKAIKLHEETEFEFSSNDSDSYENFFTNAKRKKMQLLNVISMALMFSPNLKDETDNYRITLLRSIDDVMLIEPEFILKVALYSRQELQIRTVSNFLLSYAAAHQNTRAYLEKYFEASIVLPADWIQVAEYFEVISCGQNKRPFPAALRRVMKKSFQKFDEYQLAKYNRCKTKKKQKIEEVSANMLNMMDKENVTDDSYDSDVKTILKMAKATNKAFTLKELIRSLHIDSPSKHVMCLLGKKYPKNQEEFISCGLPGVWDPEKSGKRMKLPIPETWETRISACGNKPEVWESLIDNEKLPYMAMLRNLKNLILSGISSLHHKKVITNLKNKKYVRNSRQLPMQYFEAYKVLLKLQKMIEDKDMSCEEKISQLIHWKKIQFLKMKDRIQNASISVLEEYKGAISKALEISSMNNLHPIPGKTLIICDISPQQLISSAKTKSYEACIMMGLMCLKACEDCKMCIFSSLKEMDVISLKEDQFLDVLMKTCEKYEKLMSENNGLHHEKINCPVSELEVILNSYLKSQNILSLKLNHLIFLQMSEAMEPVISSFLCKYRQLVNSDLLYTNVNFSICNYSFSGESISDKDAYVSGSSSSLIKFIAQRSTGGQLSYVENIDVKYNLPEVLESKYSRSVPSCSSESNSAEISNRQTTSMPLNKNIPKWRTLRIFISSTFKDMMSERDLLVRYVFPELKRRAASVFARIVEVDLRWGITEADSSTKRAAEICLREAQNADIFIGIIGERYGSIYNFEPPDVSDLDWVKECPTGLSITELEIHAAAFRNPQESRAKSFFYLRNNSFISYVPKKWAGYFIAEDSESKTKIDLLKQKIKSENFNVLDGYPCHWAGVCENKPILAGLDVLGNSILEDLWKVVQEIQKKEPYCDGLSEAEVYQQNLIDSKKFFIDRKNFSRDSVVNKIVSKQGIFVVYGAAGCGKTTFLINLFPYLKTFTVVKFFIGNSPRSRDLSYIIQYLCRCTCHELGVSVPFPPLPTDIVNYFSDFLHEASNCCGGREIIFLIDGLDHLEENDQRLDWLPLFLPKRIRVICSVSESSLAFKVLCERKDNSVSFLEIPPLLQAEREKFVRNYLSNYRKVLDESMFSNKMLKIVTKADSSNPFYLQIVCDFLRIYGSFETLESMLQTLPSSTALFFQEIILQMENEFGCALVQTILTLLCITKEGLDDADLHYILSFAMCSRDLKTLPSFDESKKKIASLEPENLLCQIKYCSLMSTISTFAFGQLRQESFSLVGTEFEKAVKKFYRNKSLTSYSKSLHCILAAYYHNVCDMTNDEAYKVRSGFALRSLLYHMFYGCLHKELSDLLCNVTFLKAVFLTNAESDLLEYYSSLLYDQELNREIDYSQLSSFYGFVSRNFHIFHQYPDLLIQQGLNELSSALIDLRRNKLNFYLLENLSRAYIEDYRLATLSGFTKNITASAGEKLNNIVILGTEDGYLKVLDVAARKIDRTVKAHVSEITYICCIGREQICVSSIDGTLSLWNTQDFSRISVLCGHRHNVTCCCSDPDGYILYSSGWDNTVRLWSAKDGRPISVIDDFRCPVNWIDHHPEKQTIACGLWNGNIEIWDTVSIQRKTVLPSLNGSVQCLTYTQNGINIVSSYINSEISIWSSEEGVKMSCLKGHILPVKTLSSLLYDNIVISGSDDCTLKVWSTLHRSDFASITDTKSSAVNLIELISENLVAAFQNGEISVFDINNGNVVSKIALDFDVVSIFSKYSSISINSEDFENNWDERLLVFGTESGKLMSGYLLGSSVSIVVEFHSKITASTHNSEIIVCGTSEGDIGIFYPARKLSKILYSAHKGFIGTFCLTKENETVYLLSTANDNVLKLWRVEQNDFELILEKEVLNEHRDAITFSLIHSSSSNPSSLMNLLTGSYDNNILLWDENGSVKVFQGLQASVLKIAFSGDHILGCGNDGSLVMWHRNGTILTSIPGINQSSAILTFYIEEDDSGEFAVTLAYIDLDGSIKINKPLQLAYYCSFDGHSKPITSCCATENKDVVSCSIDGSVNLWKFPLDITDGHFKHDSVVTGLILSSSLDFALSSDAHGSIVFWKIDLESLPPSLAYAGKRKYDQGFIKGLSSLKNSKFACAINQTAESGERNFLDIIQFDQSPDKTTLCLKVTKSYNFESEISSFDSCDQTDGIVVGLKSGDVIYITPETTQLYKMCNDWILGVCFFSRIKPSDYFCISYIDGRVKSFSVENYISCNDNLPEPFEIYKPPDSNESSKFTSVMCCGEKEFICSGDSDGILRIYAQSSLKFIKKVHDDLISGMCVIDSYLFTSSLDKTVKGWNLKTFKQVCQFHSQTPVSCLSSMQRDIKESEKHFDILLIGTTSGNVHLLQFHSK